MKRSLWKTFGIDLALTIILTACGTSAFPAVPATSAVMPKTDNISQTAATVTASAIVVPARQARMSFAISAPVKEILVKKGDTVKAGQPLMVLSILDLELSVKEAEWAISSATSLRDRTYASYKKVRQDNKTFYFAGFLEKRQEMDARLQVAQAELDVAKYALAQGTLLAPFDGAIVDINVQVGEIAQSGKVVIIEGEVDRMQIETTDLSERDIVNVKIGQPVSIYIKSLNISVKGKVASISPVSNTVGGDVVYKVKVAMDEQVQGLLWGMSAEVEIQTK